MVEVSSPAGLGGMNDQYASELLQLTLTVEEGGATRQLNIVVKAALQSFAAWGSVVFGNNSQFRQQTSTNKRKLI